MELCCLSGVTPASAGKSLGTKHTLSKECKMKKLMMVLPVVAGLSACVQNSPYSNGQMTQQQRTMTGALAGAALGAAVTDGNDRVKGALIGGALGAAAAQLIGQTSSGQCVYQYPDGRKVISDCQ
jgi:uncharacterized membrane protein